jgi:beta-galactosidase GanA
LTAKGSLAVLLSGFLSWAVVACPAELPRIVKSGDSGQLIVDGKPYLILGGELGNSSAGTAAQADSILPRLAAMHVNTVLIPVAWEQIEPIEGTFDFSILDHWIDVAREQHLHLVPLWFGSWKNGVSSYVPAWVKQDPKRFPRAESADGSALETLSTLGTETLKADSGAFAALMKHLKQKDENQQTVLMVQVENEVGYLGLGRDRSVTANRLFEGPVPAQLLQELQKNRERLSLELRVHFNPSGKTWRTVFGDASDEVFMAWHYARYIQAVTEAGKREYPLPMYVNCQLPAPGERAGEYPSGGPHPYYLAVYRVAAPSLDFSSPDIYWPNFEYWIDRYRFDGNAVFVPEARMDSAPYNALYAYGEAKAFGFCPFGIDSVQPAPNLESASPSIADVYQVLSELSDVLLPGQASGDVRGLVLHKDSPRPTRTVALGGYLFDATLSRTWPARSLATDDGAMIAIQSKPNEFYIAGSGLTISFTRDPDTDNKLSGIASIEEVSRDSSGGWVTRRWLNGDQSNQGRQLSMDPRRMRIYRVKLYAVDLPASTR